MNVWGFIPATLCVGLLLILAVLSRAGLPGRWPFGWGVFAMANSIAQSILLPLLLLPVRFGDGPVRMIPPYRLDAVAEEEAATAVVIWPIVMAEQVALLVLFGSLTTWAIRRWRRRMAAA